MIMKNYVEKTSGVEFVQLLKNSFKTGAMTIKEFFKIEECKIGNKKALRLLEPLI